MKLRNTNYNLANPVELIHKYQKDQELVGSLESKIVDILTDVQIPRSEHMSELISALYFALCYSRESLTLGEEYSYLTNFHPDELIFVSRKRKVLYFLLKTFGQSIAKQLD